MAFVRSAILTLIICAFLIPTVAAEEPVEPGVRMPDADAVFARHPGPVVDGVLEKELRAAGAFEELEILVQFRDGVTDVDRGFLDRLGLETVHEYSVIPAVWAKGPASAIEKLSRYEGVFWMEYNERLDYYMDMSLSTINATKAWSSPVLDEQGRVDQWGIDGEGVTVVVIDSGIDAGHPDLDYGEKTIMNLKSDTGTGPWYEIENGDTSSGHGTHCAGTVAGNGDASGGARRGVAPGANLIGLSTGELFFITGAVGALEWVYEHSRPNDNPFNIRSTSNSWGAGGGEYHPEDAISQITEKITYDNNVINVFASGNSAGDGSDIQSSNYGNTPSVICVAAIERDGSGVAVFSSRGRADLNQTFPDIGAPGVKIWSTAARRTFISSMTKQSNPGGIDPYYFAISGTSMATPHVAGLSALIWQAYPGLKVSDVHEHYQSGGDYVDDGWFNNTNTRVHEVELIMEASADYILPNGENGVPDSTNYTGHAGRPMDFAQGYGLVQADKAVALALTLKELRTKDFDGDGRADFPDATVYDAIEQYEMIMTEGLMAGDTNVLFTEWRGEWSRFNNQTNQVIPFQHDQSHMVFIPLEATSLTLDLSYDPLSATDRWAATLNMIIDYDMDGRPDYTQPSGGTQGRSSSMIDITGSGFAENRGELWSFNIEGRGVNLPKWDLRGGAQYVEIKVEYAASVSLYFPLDNGTVEITDTHMAPYVGQLMFGEPTPDFVGGQILKYTFMYDIANVEPIGKEKGITGVEPVEPWAAVIAAILMLAAAYVADYYRRHKKLPDPRNAFAKA